MIPGVKTEGRLPPNDLEAEASVLGAILLDQTAITRILDLVNPEDFYRENHGQIYRAAMQLFREGEPIDNVTLAAELEKMGVLERVGGRAHLAMLQEQTPTAANVEHYARIVRDRSYKRRLISAGTQVSTFGYDDSLDAGEAVNQAQACVYGITDDQVNSGMERLYDLLKPAMDRIDAQMASGGGVLGLSSGFHDLDRMTNGFKPSDMVVIAGRPSMGKALSLDTPIPAPRGWTTMGALRVGDQVFDDAGRPCTVVAATPVQLDRRCFAVVFDDGEQITADAEHRWMVIVDGEREGRVLTTLEMASAWDSHEFSIPACRPLSYPERILPGDPYELGASVALGAEVGLAMAGSVIDGPVATRRGGEPRAGEGRIPRAYLESGIAHRRELLRGLMDVAGTSDPAACAEFATADPELADDVMELARSLGMAPRLQPAATDGTDAFRVRVVLGMPGEVRRTIREIRPVTSVPVRCIQVDSPSHLYLAGKGCVPTHNTSFVLNLALSAAVEQKQPIAIFSLEMSKEQLVERMLCEQARIDAQRLHKGLLSEAEHERLVYALGPLGDAPIYIDDSPMLDDLTLRLKARQAKAREGIEMIMIDYLQLMHGRQRSDDGNRVQEVSAISRALKSIARELRVPVIAISQLSRAPEQRPDKRPILSDLRESGCMPASTRVLRADTNQEVTLGELLLSQERPLVWSLDSRWRLVPRQLMNAFPSGIKPVFRLRLASGYEVDATANHPFRTVAGWQRLDELKAGDAIAVPRRLPAPKVQAPLPEDELVLLAHLIGDGSIGLPGVKYATADAANRETVVEAARRRFGIEVQEDKVGNTWQLWFPSPVRLTHGRHHPMRSWLEPLGLWGKRAGEKFIPEAIHQLPDDQLALFLRHLWATDGSITIGRNRRGKFVTVYYATTSRRLADGVRRALLRLDVRTRLGRARKNGYADNWRVSVTGAPDAIRFLEVVGCHGNRGSQIPECLEILRSTQANPNVDLIPHVHVAPVVRTAMAEAGVSGRALADHLKEGYCGSYLLGSEGRPRRFSRNRLARIAQAVGAPPLADLATSDVFWDQIVEITPCGDQPTFDATVEDNHNFVANGIIAHNSIEQDADLVIFLYRDEYYNREKSEKPGIAEIIIAKHRNGPTGTVELLFRKELTRFENLDRARRPDHSAPDD